MAELPRPKTPPLSGAERKAIIQKADTGDESCLPDVRRWLDAEPTMVEANGSLTRHVLDSLVEGYTKNIIIQESVRRKLIEVQADLAGPRPTPLDWLLAERAAICWFLVSRYELAFQRASDLTVRQAEYHQRKIDAAHRRFLSAVRTLAQVRKLALPAVQIQAVGNNQINVGS